ncbi:MAG: hypothetical protein IPH77_20735 [Ignavibacteria bacterium]|nr:hypothetical protein [Ignavibacteria bacterium]
MLPPIAYIPPSAFPLDPMKFCTVNLFIVTPVTALFICILLPAVTKVLPFITQLVLLTPAM